MSKLYLRMTGDDRPQVTRRGHHYVRTSAETWTSRTQVYLDESGKVTVEISGKNGETPVTLFQGNADELMRLAALRAEGALSLTPDEASAIGKGPVRIPSEEITDAMILQQAARPKLYDAGAGRLVTVPE